VTFSPQGDDTDSLSSKAEIEIARLTSPKGSTWYRRRVRPWSEGEPSLRARWKTVLAIGLVLIALPIAALWREGIGAVSELQTDVRSVEPQGATSARVELALGTGGLELRGAAVGLMDGEFAFNVAGWRPTIDYAVANGAGHLRVAQGHGGVVLPWDVDDVDNAWDVRLADAFPLDLNVALGAGRSMLKLDGLDLTSLKIELGSGATTIDLSGDRRRDLHATITGGVGPTTIYVPRDIGVRVNVTSGAGQVIADGFERDGAAYVNDNDGNTPITLRLTIERGAGDINLVLDA
jgi:hypothetical protein